MNSSSPASAGLWLRSPRVFLLLIVWALAWALGGVGLGISTPAMKVARWAADAIRRGQGWA